MNYKEREKLLVTEIKYEKREVAKDVALLSVAAIAIGAGALGVIFLGPDVIDKTIKWVSDELSLNFSDDLMFRLQAGGLGLSLAAIGGGIKGAVRKVKEVTKDLAIVKDTKDELKNCKKEGNRYGH